MREKDVEIIQLFGHTQKTVSTAIIDFLNFIMWKLCDFELNSCYYQLMKNIMMKLHISIVMKPHISIMMKLRNMHLFEVFLNKMLH